MKVIYISGPFRADTAWDIEQNIRRAEECALEIWRQGYAAVCPHTNTRFFDGAAPGPIWLEGDLEIMRRCDAVFMVSGWERSKGATKEKGEAEALGIPVFYTLESLAKRLKFHGTEGLSLEGKHKPNGKGMEPEHDAHLGRINRIFVLVNSAKYRLGQEKHGGRLWEKPVERLVLNGLMEAIDSVNYNLSVLEQLGIKEDDILSFLHNEDHPPDPVTVRPPKNLDRLPETIAEGKANGDH